jgi:hypothetical protein
MRVCVLQVLLSGFKTNSIDDVSGVKVADFGTTRTDDKRHTDGTLHTSAKAHASTRLVVGTTPYMVSHAPSTCSSKILAHF